MRVFKVVKEFKETSILGKDAGLGKCDAEPAAPGNAMSYSREADSSRVASWVLVSAGFWQISGGRGTGGKPDMGAEGSQGFLSCLHCLW